MKLINDDFCIKLDNSHSIEEALTFVNNGDKGAVSSFIGLIRNHNEGESVAGLKYDMNKPLMMNILQKLIAEAKDKFTTDKYGLKLYIAHSSGETKIGDIAVIVMVSSAHRKESIEAVKWLIEEVKHKCPVWKQEYYINGQRNWTAGTSLRSNKE